ncbi:unnamed protein product [Anisakis simplex]|uniref:E3 ubiquitin-protein ligase HUWE1 (inferred by orthology to a human protein) n=1 Tax=Anisakis simplex TaxID=6269 RepID=A0A0M3J4A0_ANISI|nr:unnamed protein product [Anisakis simplex]
MLSWESAVLQAFNSVIKVSSSTQTDDVDEVEMSASGGATTNLITFDVPSEKTSTADEDSVARLVGSVGTECVPAPQKPTTSCPPYLLSLMMMEDCWLRTKSGVTAIGRCQRQLNELMVMLTKVCTSVPPRRRTPEPTGVSPDKNSVLLAEHLLSGYKVALESPPRLNAVSSIVLPYLSGWITNLCAILIDDRRMPYHLMLSAFYRSGCHASFMSLLDKHISLPIHAEFAQEVERFLKNWLSLAENLVNAHAFNHSPHKLARLCDEAKRFPANNYLSLLQQDVLKQMRLLFDVLMASYRNGTANVTLCELTISLYKQLIKGIINSSETTKSSVSAEERNRRGTF